MGLAGLLAATLLLGAGCGNGDDGGGDAALRVVATTSIVGDWVEQVGGNLVMVETLVPEGADAHTFTLTPGDVRTIAKADVVFISGGGLEASFIDAIEENAGGHVVDVSEGLSLQQHAADHATDPHYWMDPRLVSLAVGHIADELAGLLPGDEDALRNRALAYRDELASLDAEIEAELAQLPPERRFLVTFHDAYGYLAQRYGLTILGFVVENPDEEPSAGALADLITAMKDNDVHIIFKEPQFSARVIEQLAGDTGAEVRELPSASLSDAYPSYLAFMRAVGSAITG
jgi:ABC-type Zn uptake system ZnuABC Zn-binding protein ZnuA